MLVYPEINPIAISLGPFQIAWYGLMYLLGFLARKPNKYINPYQAIWNGPREIAIGLISG